MNRINHPGYLGYPFYCVFVSADHWSTDAVDGMNWCISWVQNVPSLPSFHS